LIGITGGDNNYNLANFMSSNFMTYKTNGIAQIMTKNKFCIIRLIKN